MQPPPGHGSDLLATPPALSPGKVLGRSFSVWRANFVPFSIVALVVFLPVIAASAAAPPEAGVSWTALDRFLTTFCGYVAEGALAFGVLRAPDGQRTGIVSLLATGFAKSGKVFAVSLVVGLLIVLGLVALIVPGLVAAAAFFVAVPAVVVEPGADSSSAMERSRDLTRGHRWTILALLATVLAVQIALGLAFAVASGLLEDVVPHPVPAIAFNALFALTAPLGATAAAVAYHDLRVAKEGVATADLVKVFE